MNWHSSALFVNLIKYTYIVQFTYTKAHFNEHKKNT